MIQYILQRSLLMIPTMIGITLISFLVMHLAPGDPVDFFLGGMAGEEGISTEGQSDFDRTREDLRRQLGLDRPLHVQYLSWLSSLVLHVEPLNNFERMGRRVDLFLSTLEPAERSELASLENQARKARFLRSFEKHHPDEAQALVLSSFWEGKTVKLKNNYEYTGAGLLLFHLFDRRFVTLNFGRSFKDQQPVISHILARVPITIEINIISLIVAYIIGLPLGIWLAVKQDTRTDRTLTTGTFILWSMPSFWVGMLLIVFFCNKEFFYWFPASGIQSLDASSEWGFWRLLTDHAHHMAMPVLASSYASFAGLSRFMRTSMLENLRLDYVRTARAKGLPEKVVILKHVFRNSLIPIVTILANLLPAIIAGSVFIETIFTIPGLGYLGVQSVLVRDYPMVMAILTIGSFLSLLGILLADVLLKVVDPRIEFSRLQG